MLLGWLMAAARTRGLGIIVCAGPKSGVLILNHGLCRAKVESDPRSWVRPGRFLACVQLTQQELQRRSDRSGAPPPANVMERLEDIRRESLLTLQVLASVTRRHILLHHQSIGCTETFYSPDLQFIYSLATTFRSYW